MNDVNFSVRISPERARRVDIFLAGCGETKTALVNHVIDNILELRPKFGAATKGKK